MISEKKKAKLIAECVESLDYDRIRAAMVALDWVWVGVRGTPTVADLKGEAERLLNAAFDGSWRHRGKRWYCSCGGLNAEASAKKGWCRVAFEVADWDASVKEAGR